MRNFSFAAGFAIIIMANGFALIHVVRNRSGSPSQEITLTNRELQYPSRVPSDDNSGVTLHLQWNALGSSGNLYSNGVPIWLDAQKLQQLGFDCSVPPSAANAMRFYQLQRSRRAFIALEYDGEAWRTLLDKYNASSAKKPAFAWHGVSNVERASHLVAIDADLDAGTIRTRHPDRSSVLIVPGVVGLSLNQFSKPSRVEGRIEQIPTEVHVSRPLSEQFENWRPGNQELASQYSVRLRYGKLLEPWVTHVEFGQ